MQCLNTGPRGMHGSGAQNTRSGTIGVYLVSSKRLDTRSFVACDSCPTVLLKSTPHWSS